MLIHTVLPVKCLLGYVSRLTGLSQYSVLLEKLQKNLQIGHSRKKPIE